ncbi:Flp family type IVb pilin [Erythrobacter sp.]|jgi:pilus assembly protein Flp/PilA|uniref:Flp family type IVb pilin n=1 Tax=Erythrobacter sp. TaxID=1042 RepID=UPI002EC300CD|nr:Flp family type IVb pilin [Erythrobacter sp.]
MHSTPFLKSIWKDESGVTAVEYGLILSLVVVAILVAFQGLALTTTSIWDDMAEQSDEAMG